MKSFLRWVWLLPPLNEADKPNDLDQIIVAVKDASEVWLTEEEIKDLVAQRRKNIDIFILENIVWNTYKAIKKVDDYSWRDWIWIDDSIEVIEINTWAENPKMIITISDADGNIISENMTIAIWVFLSRWCLKAFWLDKLLEEAEKKYPITW